MDYRRRWLPDLPSFVLGRTVGTVTIEAVIGRVARDAAAAGDFERGVVEKDTSTHAIKVSSVTRDAAPIQEMDLAVRSEDATATLVSRVRVDVAVVERDNAALGEDAGTISLSTIEGDATLREHE